MLVESEGTLRLNRCRNLLLRVRDEEKDNEEDGVQKLMEVIMNGSQVVLVTQQHGVWRSEALALSAHGA